MAATIHVHALLRIACILIFEYAASVMGGDPDPLSDYCVTDPSSALLVAGFPCKSSVSPSDFSSTLLNVSPDTDNALGIAVTLAGGGNFGGLNTQGLSIARLDYALGGLVPPHVHPRASEVLVVMKGRICAAFVDGSNVLYSQTLNPLEMFVFPRGLIHYSVNVGSEPAFSISAFNSQSPGLSLVGSALFAANDSIPDFVLQKALHLTLVEVELIKASFRA